MEPDEPELPKPPSPWAPPTADTESEPFVGPPPFPRDHPATTVPTPPPPQGSGWQTGDPNLPIARVPVAEQRRRWPWIVALSVVGIAAIAGAALAYTTYQKGEDWKERALDSEDESAALAEELAASEDDVSSLEERVDSLADEKAAVEDERELVEGERDIAAGLAVLATDAADKTQICLGDIDSLLAGVLDAWTYDTGIDHLMPAAETADANCAAADESYVAFADAIDGL